MNSLGHVVRPMGSIMEFRTALHALGAEALSAASRFTQAANSRARWPTLHSRVETTDMQEDCVIEQFRYETDLRAPCVSWVDSRYACPTVIDEADVSHLSPDLVIGTQSDFLPREEQGFPAITNWSQLALARSVWSAPGHSLDGASLRSAGRSVRPLIENGVMRKVGDKLEVAELPERPFGEIIAIELKMKDWRKAIRQAARYQSFADLSYIAMPETAVRDEVLNAAEMLGVGVLALAPGRCELIADAEPSTIIDPALASLASELLFSTETGQKQFPRAAGSRRGIATEPVLVG